ncbi:uncharacterized protein ACN427_001457 [Glossina fuscipes fuscipes]
MFIKTLVIILMLIVRFFIAIQSSPILGEETEIDDRSIIQGRLKPIYSHCDDIDPRINPTMLDRSGQMVVRSCRVCGVGWMWQNDPFEFLDNSCKVQRVAQKLHF